MWIQIQALCRAGTSCSEGSVRSEAAQPIMMKPTGMTSTPRGRTRGLESETAR
jgi:hypothetical protein